MTRRDIIFVTRNLAQHTLVCCDSLSLRPIARFNSPEVFLSLPAPFICDADVMRCDTAPLSLVVVLSSPLFSSPLFSSHLRFCSLLLLVPLLVLLVSHLRASPPSHPPLPPPIASLSTPERPHSELHLCGEVLPFLRTTGWDLAAESG
mmetsp:Transcript_6497/g.9242  ORF Transcript_6497/g.9242 Transcript_6497/m.9242 type:complete len:148 (+) Transcript_6497:117-560(+)